MAGGYTIRVVEAASIVEARKAAIEEAERDLAKVASWPTSETLRWSVEYLREGKPEKSVETDVFRFYRQKDEFVSEDLGKLANSLVKNDLYLSVIERCVAVVAESDENFTVEIRDDGDEITVRAANWHHHYADPEQAIACFRWLLTPYYRVVEETQGGELSCAWLERFENTGWQPMESMIFRNPTDPTAWMGGKWKREYRQQALLRPPRPYSELFRGVFLDENDMPPGSKLGLTVETHAESMAVEQGWLNDDRLP